MNPFPLSVLVASAAIVHAAPTIAPMPPGYAERLATAIHAAEGGDRARRPYGILSVPVKSKAHARQVCLNSISNNWQRWQATGAKGDYIDFLASRWAPISARNDPKNLNANWAKNVKARMLKP